MNERHAVKLVMLPGMDGTGELFSRFLDIYDGPVQVITLPQYGDQSYLYLAKVVSTKLPSEKFILLAESFSGGLVQHLLDSDGLLGVIFVASFVSAPNKLMLLLAKLLPRRSLTYLPGSKLFCKYLFLGSRCPDDCYDSFVNVLRSGNRAVMNSRIQSMLKLKYVGQSKTNLPCACIRPNGDRLVGVDKIDEILKIFKKSHVYNMDGPHFFMHSEFKKAAGVVKTACEWILCASSQ